MPRKRSQCGRRRPALSTISSKTPGIGRYASTSVLRSTVAWAALVASMALSKPSRPPQVEGQRIIERGGFERRIEYPRRVSKLLEPRPAPPLRLVGVDRVGLVVASARMRHMIDAAAERAPT